MARKKQPTKRKNGKEAARETAATKRQADKAFVSWRRGCPWIKKSGMQFEMFRCHATDLKCRKVNCAVMHLIERSKI